MNIIKDSRPLEPLPVITEDNRVTEWIPRNCGEIETWYNWLVSTGLRAIIDERDNSRHGQSRFVRAVYRHPAATMRSPE